MKNYKKKIHKAKVQMLESRILESKLLKLTPECRIRRSCDSPIYRKS